MQKFRLLVLAGLVMALVALSFGSEMATTLIGQNDTKGVQVVLPNGPPGPAVEWAATPNQGDAARVTPTPTPLLAGPTARNSRVDKAPLN